MVCLNQGLENSLKTTAGGREDEVNSAKRLTEVAMQLTMIAMARPDLITSESKHGTAKLRGKTTTVFKMRWLGEKYRCKSEAKGGTHASPKVHRRAGHQRKQRFGSKRCDVKTIWVEPVWVNL